MLSMYELALNNNRSFADVVFEGLDITPATRKDYKYRIQHYFDWLNLYPLNENTLVQYKNSLREDTRLSVATKNKYLLVARIFLKELQRKSGVGQLSLLNLSVKNFQQSKKHKVFGLDELEALRIVDWMNRHENNYRSKAILCLLMMQGLRQAEICSLKIEDFDPLNATLMVKGKGMDDKEVVHLHSITVDILVTYIHNLSGYREILKSGVLFSSRTKQGEVEHLTTRGLQVIVKKILRELGINKNIHGFRHYFTTHLIKNTKGNLLQVAQFTRHRSIETLQIYNDAILETEQVDDFRDAFNGLAAHII
jgi:integrase/recombinase XerC